ncbi:MAG TPA: hypothetical protein VFQ83_14620 [Candidatus Udaeobacter sp.]|jgi:hypothetical protein|nr:hypothetical protein [Candidatus Udaeobacter sp.]
MKRVKSVIAFMFPVALWVSATSIEYDVVVNLGFLLSLFISVLALCVLLGALFRAPEGYEDQNGFHVGVSPGFPLL